MNSATLHIESAATYEKYFLYGVLKEIRRPMTIRTKFTKS